MDPTVQFVIILLVVVVAIIILMRMLGIKIITVSDGEQVVVSRLGRIHRILSPGVRILFGGFEKIERKLNVREQPHSVFIELLFFRGIPFGYTLNLWYRNDLLAATNGDQQTWRQLALFSDDERRAQVVETVRDLLARCLNDFADREQVPPDAPFVMKLLPIFPAIEENTIIIEDLKTRLSQALPALGVVVSHAQPITIQKIHIGKDLRRMFTLGRTVAQLRELDPKMSSDQMLRLFGSIEGLDMSHMRELTFNQFDGESSDVKVGENGAVETEHRLQQERRMTRNQPEPAARAANNAPLTHGDNRITKDDVRVLKQVPRAAH